RMQKLHAGHAMDCGVPEENCFIMDNGEVLSLSENTAQIAGKIPSGSVYIDGSGIGDIGNIVLRDRRILSEEGLVVVVVSINMKEFKIASGPDIISRGFVYMRESGDLINDAQSLITKHLNKVMERKTTQWSEIKNEITDTLSPFLYEKTKRRPMILPIIMEVQ
ncbi:MAG: ribonuclease J, partial [Peribacillus sp.]